MKTYLHELRAKITQLEASNIVLNPNELQAQIDQAVARALEVAQQESNVLLANLQHQYNLKCQELVRIVHGLFGNRSTMEQKVRAL
jgi:hypothetical protein